MYLLAVGRQVGRQALEGGCSMNTKCQDSNDDDNDVDHDEVPCCGNQ